MKFKDLPINCVNEINDKECYIISNIVKKDENDEIVSLDKCLVPLNSLGYREEIITLSEQNSKLVELINNLLKGYQTVTANLSKLEEKINSLVEKPLTNTDLTELTNSINELQHRFESNIIEL